MWVVWGRHSASDVEGVVGDLCPACRAVRAFHITHRYEARHFQGIRIEQGRLAGATRQCITCKGWWAAEPTHYATYHPAYGVPVPEVEPLLAETHPDLVELLAAVARLKAGGQSYRVAAADEDTAGRIEAALIWFVALGGDGVAEVERLTGFWQLPGEARAAEIARIEAAAQALSDDRAQNFPGWPARLQTPFQRAIALTAVVGAVAAGLSAAGAIVAVRTLDHVDALPVIVLAGATAASLAGFTLWRIPRAVLANRLAGAGGAGLLAGFVAVLAHDAAYCPVLVDNASRDDVRVLVDGVERMSVGAKQQRGLLVKRGSHRMSWVGRDAERGKEVGASFSEAGLYNPGATASYYVETVYYGRNALELDDRDGPLPPNELHTFDFRVHHWFEEAPEKQKHGTERIAILRDPIGMHFVACDADVRQELSRCVRRAMRARAKDAVERCIDSATRDCPAAADE
jgi:hypothetical protein